MRICFYLDLDKHSNVDLKNPELGNPGIGGTQFMIWQLSYYLKKVTDNDIYVLSPNIDKLPDSLHSIKVDNIFEAINYSKTMGADIFVFRSVSDSKVYDLIESIALKSIAWGHNFPDNIQLNYLANTENVVKYVCVGIEQYQMLRDHKVFLKSEPIYNALDFTIYNKNDTEKEKIICYIGSIVPSKGFHILARNWSYIEKRHPDVKLRVIGSGQLYNRNQRLGPYGVAEENYEKKFMRYLIDSEGNIKSSIEFLGILGGSEKIQKMSESRIGVVNPSGNTETFGIGAVEFQSLGVPVVTKAKNGFFDTVSHLKTGLLFKSEKKMVKYILNLLEDNEKYNSMRQDAYKFARENFDIYDIATQWDELFNSIVNDSNDEVRKNPNKNNLKLKNNYNWLREFNRRLKRISFLRKIPAIIEYKNIFKLIYLKFKL
ncbi:glycosyltransferase family 4 protein [Bacillus sp. S34]|nr:glycosyltransferase family 4 protein [Bacillus sp. S34]